jgi:hypothetical protein
MEKHIKKHKKQSNDDNNSKNKVNIELLKEANPDKTVFD